jgi:hypothetical protein
MWVQVVPKIGDVIPVARLIVAFDALPIARWGPLFHVLCLERPGLQLRWRPMGFPKAAGSILAGADVGLFVAPPAEAGLSAVTLERSAMVVIMAVGHRLARYDELTVADVIAEPFPGGATLHPQWLAFWTLDAQRGRPARRIDDVENAE